MATLAIASKGNQATTFPALLVAHYAKAVDPSSDINVDFEEIETFEPGQAATVKLVLGNGAPIYGTENIIGGLVDEYCFLQTKQDKLVGLRSSATSVQKLSTYTTLGK